MLNEEEQTILNKLLCYSDKMKTMYEWKEAFIEWYDCSSSYTQAMHGFSQWI